MDSRGATGIVGIACMLLTLCFIISPFLYAPGSMYGLEGTAGIMDRPWSLSQLPYCLGDLFCHQDPARSIILNGNQMPICIRDVGILVGLSIGLLACYASDFVPRSRAAMAVTILLCMVTVVEWCLENIMYMPDVVRGVSGAISGIGAGSLGSWMIAKVYEKG